MSDRDTGGGAAGATPDPYAPFRPRRGRAVAAVAAVASLVIFTGVAIAVPGATADQSGWGPVDRAVCVGLGAAMAAFLWRYASLRAVPTRTGLVVRNLLITRRLEWTEILRVSFSGGAPWVVLELTDTEQVAVMAIQKADGPRGRAEASRLAALVEFHSTAPE